MKNKISLVFLIAGFSLLSHLNAQVDSLSVKPLIIPQDSIPNAYQWTPRSPLSAAEQQQRADNRVEVENMKQRFRQFHEAESNKKTEDQIIEEDQDYIWTEAIGGPSNNVDTSRVNNSSGTNTEALKLEINRSFQQETISTKPALSPSKTAPIIEQKKINSDWTNNAFKASSSTVDWQLNIGQPTMHLTIGQTVLLEGVQFEAHSAELSQPAKNALNRWPALFQQNPGMKIEVQSHTHENIPYTEALELTARRARAINDYLMSLGIPEQQLIFRGYGKLSPLFSTSNGHNQQKNERIEVIILELPNH